MKLKLAVIVSFLLGLFLITPLAQIKLDPQGFINSSGSFLAPVKGLDGTVSAPAYSFTSEPGLGWYRTGASGIALAGNSSKQIFSIASDGSIAMSNPSVNGGNATTLIALDGSSFFRVAAGLNLGGKIAAYNGVTLSGNGVPAIVASGRSVAQTAGVASVTTYTVGASDSSFEIDANILVTVATTHSFQVNVAYTDEGNTARTIRMELQPHVAGGFTLTDSVSNTNGAVPYTAYTQHIRCKSATVITVSTSGTFTTVTYNVEGFITQVS